MHLRQKLKVVQPWNHLNLANGTERHDIWQTISRQFGEIICIQKWKKRCDHFPAKSGPKDQKWKVSIITWINHHPSIDIGLPSSHKKFSPIGAHVHIWAYVFWHTFFNFWFFGPLLAGKWAWPPHAPLMVRGLQTRPKIWPSGWTFCANRYLEIMFSKLIQPPQPILIYLTILNK